MPPTRANLALPTRYRSGRTATASLSGARGVRGLIDYTAGFRVPYNTPEAVVRGSLAGSSLAWTIERVSLPTAAGARLVKSVRIPDVFDRAWVDFLEPDMGGGQVSLALTARGTLASATPGDPDAAGPADLALAPAGFGGSIFPVAGLATITPSLTLTRSSGATPCAIMADARATTANAGEPYTDLEYKCSVDAPPEVLTNPVTGLPVDSMQDQTGPLFCFLFNTAGTYTITLTVRGWNGVAYVTASTTATVTISEWQGETRYFDPDAPTTLPSPLLAVTANQELAPNDRTDAGFGWKDLGTVTITKGALSVRLTDQAEAGQFVVADAVRIERTDGESLVRIIDNTDPACQITGSWQTGADSGTIVYYGGDTHYTSGGTGTKSFVWPVRDLPNGTYRVSATWAPHTNRATDARYSVHDGTVQDGLSPDSAWTTTSQLWAWSSANATNRRTLLKAGTVWNQHIQWDREVGARVGVYGEGAPPQINFVNARVGRGWGARDCVMEGIAFATNGQTGVVTGGDEQLPMGPLEHVAFIRCHMPRYQWELYESSRCLTWWGCQFVRGAGAVGTSLFVQLIEWLAVVGCLFEGGEGSTIYEHHIYPKVLTNTLYRWVETRLATLNFAINGDCPRDLGATGCLISDCKLAGTHNGFDWSNHLNTTNEGSFDLAIAQGNLVQPSLTVGDQGLGLLVHSLKRFAVRDCEFRDCRKEGVSIHLDTPISGRVYRCTFRTRPGVAAYYGPARAWVGENAVIPV